MRHRHPTSRWTSMTVKRVRQSITRWTAKTQIMRPTLQRPSTANWLVSTPKHISTMMTGSRSAR